jgi:peptidylprolyl isomerase
MRRLVLLPLLTLVLAACGGGDDTSDAAASAPEGAELAAAGNQVSVHYTGSLDDGTEFDSSVGKDPLQFQVGAGQMIPGFDAAVQGMAVGETKTVTFGPEEGYGEWDEAMTMEVPLSDLPEGAAVGDDLIAGDGSVTAKVTEISGEMATLDLNHFLAGKALTFEITLVSIDS